MVTLLYVKQDLKSSQYSGKQFTLATNVLCERWWWNGNTKHFVSHLSLCSLRSIGMSLSYDSLTLLFHYQFLRSRCGHQSW